MTAYPIDEYTLGTIDGELQRCGSRHGLTRGRIARAALALMLTRDLPKADGASLWALVAPYRHAIKKAGYGARGLVRVEVGGMLQMVMQSALQAEPQWPEPGMRLPSRLIRVAVLRMIGEKREREPLGVTLQSIVVEGETYIAQWKRLEAKIV